jgi:hypothetical protein
MIELNTDDIVKALLCGHTIGNLCYEKCKYRENERCELSEITVRNMAADLIESLRAQLDAYKATGLNPGDIKDMQEICKKNGLAKYVNLIAKAKQQMVKSNEYSIDQDARIEQLESRLSESQRREKAAIEEIKITLELIEQEDTKHQHKSENMHFHSGVIYALGYARRVLPDLKKLERDQQADEGEAE